MVILGTRSLGLTGLAGQDQSDHVLPFQKSRGSREDCLSIDARWRHCEFRSAGFSERVMVDPARQGRSAPKTASAKKSSGFNSVSCPECERNRPVILKQNFHVSTKNTRGNPVMFPSGELHELVVQRFGFSRRHGG